MDALSLVVTASSILFGFLFAGFWWALDRELKFLPPERHFKFGYLLLLVTMAIVAIFGILRPLWTLVAADPGYLASYTGLVIAIVGVFGYMLTEFAHYRIFQWPKYITPSEYFFFGLTIVSMLLVALWGLLR